MPNWKADLDALIDQTMAFAKTIHAQEPKPRNLAEPSSIPPVRWMGSQRDEIEQRVAKFKALQQRLRKEREDYAASELMRMRAAIGGHSSSEAPSSSGAEDIRSTWADLVRPVQQDRANGW